MSSSSSSKKSMESLAEIFRCFICMEKLRNAYMCPHCSKLCCYTCIRRWLTETRTQCPHCRSTLHIHEVVNCRWAEEVTQQLDSLQVKEVSMENSKLSQALLETNFPSEKCTTHIKEDVSVYCISCDCCICHECALWSSAHAGHNFKPLDEVYKTHCRQIQEHVLQVRHKLRELIGSIQDVEKNIEHVRSAKDQRVREIRNAVELMIARLDAHLKTKLMTLVNQKSHLSRKSEEVEAMLIDIDKKLMEGPKSELINNRHTIIQKIQDTLCKCTFSIAPVPVDFPSELVPIYDSSTFAIQKFSQLRLKADPFYSEPLKVNGLSWRLKVYPDGNGVVRGSYLSVFLELSEGPPETAKYEYRIEMIHPRSSETTKNMVREFASDFETGECWGYNRFFRLDLLETEGFWEPETDLIKLRFDVRPPTYFQQCKDQQWFINQLQETCRNQLAQNFSLNERIKSMGPKVTAVAPPRDHPRATWNSPKPPLYPGLRGDNDNGTPSQLFSPQHPSYSGGRSFSDAEFDESSFEANLDDSYRLGFEERDVDALCDEHDEEDVDSPRDDGNGANTTGNSSNGNANGSSGNLPDVDILLD